MCVFFSQRILQVFSHSGLLDTDSQDSSPELGLSRCSHATLENFVALIYLFGIPHSTAHLI